MAARLANDPGVQKLSPISSAEASSPASASAGGQLGYTVSLGELDANLNVKAYKEFAAANRPEGWNLWLTYTLPPAEPKSKGSTAPPRRADAR